jgi:Xaa-Pro aminopeptidase
MLQPFVPVKEIQDRRKYLQANLHDGEVVIVFSNLEQMRNRDNSYPFRQHSDFWYLTGLNEADSVLIISQTETVLFVQAKDQTKEIWTGVRNGVEQSQAISGIDNVTVNARFEKYLQSNLQQTTKFYISNESQVNPFYRQLQDHLDKFELEIEDTRYLIGDLRMIKSKWEVEQLKIVAKHNILTHQHLLDDVFPRIKSGQLKPSETILEAELLYQYNKQGLTWSYYPVVASGNNACTLHYDKNSASFNLSDGILIDAGCEYNYYASDITRTYFVDGLSTAQREIYDLVKNTCLEVYKAIKNDFSSFNIKENELLIIKILSLGLLDLGILRGSLESVLESKSYRQYYMHSGHFLGLDTHDNSQSRSQLDQQEFVNFTKGSSFTVEPALYFNALDESVPRQYRGIGIRLEDNLVINHSGEVEIITSDLPFY